MELLYATAAIATLALIGKALGYTILHVLFNVIEVVKKGQVRRCDHILTKHVIVGNETPEGRRGTGWHLIWYNQTLVLFYKESNQTQKGDDTEKCIVYFPRWIGNLSKKTFQSEIVKDENRVLKRFSETLCPWREDSMDYPNKKITVPKHWQKLVVDKVINLYKNQKMVSVLIVGPPRLGKSTTAWFIAQAISELNKFGRVIVVPIDLTIPGRSILPVLDNEEDDCVVLLRDEWDGLCKKTMEPPTSKEFTCWAESKGSLNSIDDFLREQERVIIVDTTNVTDICTVEEYSSFIQRHDFVFHINEAGEIKDI